MATCCDECIKGIEPLTCLGDGCNGYECSNCYDSLSLGFFDNCDCKHCQKK